MIEKIIKITNVGRFINCNSKNNDLTFRKITLIFGYNTYGKSTLTAIFRSLKENDTKYILGRKTFKSATSQEIEILFQNNSISRFPNNSWNYQNIEIFDNDFINRNVFLW
jgi:wobble nucleotide-excising tRNase